MEPTFVDKYIAPYWKAVLGFLVPGVTVVSTALLTKGVITANDWLQALFASILTAGGVYAVKNKPQV